MKNGPLVQKPEPSAKDKAKGELILDAVAPLSIKRELDKLSRRYGQEQTLRAIQAWVNGLGGDR